MNLCFCLLVIAVLLSLVLPGRATLTCLNYTTHQWTEGNNETLFWQGQKLNSTFQVRSQDAAFKGNIYKVTVRLGFKNGTDELRVDNIKSTEEYDIVFNNNTCHVSGIDDPHAILYCREAQVTVNGLNVNVSNITYVLEELNELCTVYCDTVLSVVHLIEPENTPVTERPGSTTGGPGVTGSQTTVIAFSLSGILGLILAFVLLYAVVVTVIAVKMRNRERGRQPERDVDPYGAGFAQRGALPVHVHVGLEPVDHPPSPLIGGVPPP